MIHTPVNKEFYEKTRAFVLTAVGFLLSCTEGGEELPSRTVERAKIGWERVYMSSHSPLTLYSSFIGGHRKEIEGLPEFEPLYNLMSSDTTISKHLNKLVGTRENLIFRTVWDYLSYFLYKQISRSTDKLEFDPKTFDNMYYDLEQFFYHDNVDLQVFSPLHNFSSDVDEIDLGKDLRIRRSTSSDSLGILSQSPLSQIPYSDMNYLEWKIELTYQTKKVVLEKPNINSMSRYTSEMLTIYRNVNAIFDKLVTALRLFKSGIVGFNVIKRKPMADIPIILRDPFIGSTGIYSQFSGPQYTLTGTEVSEFRSFWDKFRKTKLFQIAPLGVAIRRFNYAYGRDKLEDKLIDYMIAFEALFSGDLGEFSHKLAVRVSRLLKQDYEERKDMMKEMKSFYSKRSKVLHGVEVHDLDDDFVNKVESHLRESIKLFSDRLQSISHDEILFILDLGEP